MFENELNYFISNQKNLVSKFQGKVLVIKDSEVVGVFENALDAYLDAKSRFELGTFMIQPCIPGPEAYTVSIASHEIFA
jgi:hypothetical protein